MIKFFNKIRKQLIIENKTSKYLKYAVGEVLLVMIGILLALQVNNWNQKRIASDKETILLNELHEEFKKNKTQLDTVISFHFKALKSTNSLINSFPIDLNTINLDSLESKFDGFGYHYTFNPSQGVINSLVSTSSFEIISNESLRKLLISWNDVLVDYQEEEIRANHNLQNHINPYLKKYLPWRYNFKDKRIDLTVFTTLEFENQVHNRRNDLVNIVGDPEITEELENIKKTIDHIIEYSQTK